MSSINAENNRKSETNPAVEKAKRSRMRVGLLFIVFGLFDLIGGLFTNLSWVAYSSLAVLGFGAYMILTRNRVPKKIYQQAPEATNL